ncbi:MAG: ferrous iron transporter B, partial [Lentisphaeria bacterium]|nr:ferrous iron transporter B [Lentisphaeria bacterium]
MMKNKFRIALAGNPNCGKTSIFNVLTGTRQHVGNYPGVTVESKSGTFSLGEFEIELIDLPGVYSLSSSSPEEEVVFKELTSPGIDLIINVIDSTIPQRSLYLTTQLAELHIPMLLTFNMSDDARKKGMKYNIPKLEKYFGSPIVQTVGSQSSGVRPLLSQLGKTLNELEDHGVPMLSYGSDIDDAINAVAEKIDALNVEKYRHVPARFFAIKLLEHDTAAMKIDEFKSVAEEVEIQIKHLWDKHAINADTFMADRRYAMLAGACRETISMTQERRREISDKIDLVLTNKYLGLPVFLVIMYAAFWFTFTCAEPFMGYIENFFEWLKEVVGIMWSAEKAPFMRSMVIEGIIGGVGGVIAFLPNILFLFFAIALLEDSGYMSRAAFIM